MPHTNNTKVVCGQNITTTKNSNASRRTLIMKALRSALSAKVLRASPHTSFPPCTQQVVGHCAQSPRPARPLFGPHRRSLGNTCHFTVLPLKWSVSGHLRLNTDPCVAHLGCAANNALVSSYVRRARLVPRYMNKTT